MFKQFKVALLLLAFLAVYCGAFAAVGVLNNGSMVGTATDINFDGSYTYSLNGTVLNLGNSSNTLISPAIVGGSIENATIGIVTATAGNFTVINATGNITTSKNLTVTQNATVSGNLSVAKAAALTGNVTFAQEALFSNANVTGLATLVNGVANVSSTTVTNSSQIFLTRQAILGVQAGGNNCTLSITAVHANVWFNISSTDPKDNSTVAYLVVN